MIYSQVRCFFWFMILLAALILWYAMKSLVTCGVAMQSRKLSLPTHDTVAGAATDAAADNVNA